MTEIATIDWFGRWGTSVFSEKLLYFKNHISQVTKKANSMLGFLRPQTKTTAYFTMVRSNLDYCCTIWNPYQQDQKYQIEMVQWRAAWFVTNRYRNTPAASIYIYIYSLTISVGSRMRLEVNCSWPFSSKSCMDLLKYHPQSIWHRQHQEQDQHTPSSFSSTLLSTSTDWPRCWLGGKTLTQTNKQNKTSTDCYKYSFFPKTIPLWNPLLPAVAESLLFGILQEGAIRHYLLMGTFHPSHERTPKW